MVGVAKGKGEEGRDIKKYEGRSSRSYVIDREETRGAGPDECRARVLTTI